MNHNDEATTHYMINKKLEKDEDEAEIHKSYIVKKSKLDMKIFRDPSLFIEDEEEREKFFKYKNKKIKYIMDKKEFLDEKNE